MPKITHVAADEDGIRLDRWFKRHYPGLSHGLLEKLLRKGEVRIDGKRASASDRIEKGQALRLPPQIVHGDNLTAPVRAKAATAAPAPDQGAFMESLVLYMDTSVIVLNKPPGLATQGGSGLTRHIDGMLDSLMFERRQRPKLVHRLDRDTSGVLVIARTHPAAAFLAKALQARDATKVYWALTRGVPAKKRGTINRALAKEGGHGSHGRDERMTLAGEDSEDAKFAITDYAVLGTAGSDFAFVAAKPVTGRTHQIRVHLASLETPIVGDFKYGGTSVRGRGDIEDKMHLHARTIDVPHPDGGRIQVTAPLPPHMAKSWALLGFDPDDKSNPFPSAKMQKQPRAKAPESIAPRQNRTPKKSRAAIARESKGGAPRNRKPKTQTKTGPKTRSR